MAKRKRWFRDDYADAVWDSEALRPNEVLVALAYAKYAGEDDVAWVKWERLSQMTGMRSKDAVNRATRGLVAAGWLVLVERARQHRSPRYRLVIPTDPDVRVAYVWEAESAEPEVRLADNWPRPEVRETTPEVRETTSRGTRGVPEYSDRTSDRSNEPVVPVGAQPQEVDASLDDETIDAASNGHRVRLKAEARAAARGGRS